MNCTTTKTTTIGEPKRSDRKLGRFPTHSRYTDSSFHKGFTNFFVLKTLFQPYSLFYSKTLLKRMFKINVLAMIEKNMTYHIVVAKELIHVGLV